MSFNQKGGSRTPWPLRYFHESSNGHSNKECNFSRNQTSYNACGHPMAIIEGQSFGNCCKNTMDQSGGTPLPMAYFNPYLETRPGYQYVNVYSPAKCGYFAQSVTPGTFYRGDKAKMKAEKYAVEAAEDQKGGAHCCRPEEINPLPCKFLGLDRNLNTLGNNAEVINRDNLRRLFNTYKKTYGVAGLNIPMVKSLFSNPSNWSEFRNADYTVGELLKIVHNRLTGRVKQNRSGTQNGGGAVGAPFFIPEFGRNPNLASGQMNETSQVTNGFSYRFDTGTDGGPFCSLWGDNLPTFNRVPPHC